MSEIIEVPQELDPVASIGSEVVLPNSDANCEIGDFVDSPRESKSEDVSSGLPSPLTSPEMDGNGVNTDNVGTESINQPVPSDTKVCIRNIPFNTADSDLEEFFSDYQLLCVFIPTFTVHLFKHSRFRPLGIAYAEFQTKEAAKRVIEELNNTKFQNRAVVIKPYVPFVSRKKFNVSSETNDFEHSLQPTASSAQSAHSTGVYDKLSAGHVESNDTLFISRVPYRVSISDIQEYFDGYTASAIYLFQHKLSEKRTRSISFSAKTRSAIITFEGLNDERGLELIIETFLSKKLFNRFLNLRPAFVDKVEEIQLNEVRKKYIINSYKKEGTLDSEILSQEDLKSAVVSQRGSNIDVISQEQAENQLMS